MEFSGFIRKTQINSMCRRQIHSTLISPGSSTQGTGWIASPPTHRQLVSLGRELEAAAETLRE